MNLALQAYTLGYNSKITTLALLIALLILLSACGSPVKPLLKETLARPVSCPLAAGDIALLRSYQPDLGDRVASGVRAVMPIGAVTGIAKGTQGDKVDVALGSINSQIDAKISAIRHQCPEVDAELKR